MEGNKSGVLGQKATQSPSADDGEDDFAPWPTMAEERTNLVKSKERAAMPLADVVAHYGSERIFHCRELRTANANAGAFHLSSRWSCIAHSNGIPYTNGSDHAGARRPYHRRNTGRRALCYKLQLIRLAQALYEYLGEEYPEVLGSIAPSSRFFLMALEEQYRFKRLHRARRPKASRTIAVTRDAEPCATNCTTPYQLKRLCRARRPLSRSVPGRE
jgi:hypothetical protein